MKKNVVCASCGKALELGSPALVLSLDKDHVFCGKECLEKFLFFKKADVIDYARHYMVSETAVTASMGAEEAEDVKN